MKAKRVKIIVAMMFMLLLNIGIYSTLYATSYTSQNIKTNRWDSVNYYKYNVAGGHTDASYNRYILKAGSESLTTFCVQPDIEFSGNVTYNVTTNRILDDEKSCKVSYIICQLGKTDANGQQINGQVVQAAIWSTVRPDGTLTAANGSDVTPVLTLAQDAASKWNPSQNAVVDGNIKYLPCTEYEADRNSGYMQTPDGTGYKYYIQQVVTPNFEEVKEGYLKVKKVDEHGKAVAGAKFRIVGPQFPDGIDVVTNENGESEQYTVKVGEYTVTETSVPGNLTRKKTAVVNNVESEKLVVFTFENAYQRGKATLIKEDVFKRSGKVNYGDGSLEGVRVDLYAGENISEGETPVLSENQLIATRYTKKDGSIDEIKDFTANGISFDGLPLGRYYWVETQSNSSYLNWNQATVADAQVEKHYITVTYEGMEKEESDVVSTTIYDQEVYTAVSVYKMDNSNKNDENQGDVGEKGPDDKNPAEGARLRLTLKSNYNEETGEPIDPTHDTYEADVDKYGKAEFINPEFEQKFKDTGIDMKYTIPYGEYVLDEIKTSTDGNSYFYGIQNKSVEAKINNKTESFIVMDEPIPVDLEVIKKDKETGDTIGIEGVTFKVWDLQANDGKGGWIKQRLGTGSHEEVSEFKTNSKGYLILPEKLYAGKYIVYEVESAKGYYLEDKYRIPKENGVEKPGTNGELIDITNTTVKVEDAKEYPNGGIDRDYIEKHLKFVVEIEDPQLKTKLEIYKEGEMFTNVKQNTSEYPETEFDEILEETAPVYEMRPLEGVKFEVKAKEDLYTEDGRLNEKAGTVHYLTTKADGTGRCTIIENGEEVEEELYRGTYIVTEIETPPGYEPCEPFEVVLDNNDQYKRIEITNKNVENKYVPASINFEKIFEKGKDNILYKAEFENEEDQQKERAYAIFGIYNKNELTTVNGNVTIPADTLIQSFVVYDGDPYTKTMKLPDGEYYFEELYVKYPWIMTDEEGNPSIYDFEIDHKKGETEPIEIEKKARNPITKNEVNIIKVSESSIISSLGMTLTSTELDKINIKEATDMLTKEINDRLLNDEIDLEETLNELTDEGVILLDSAKFEVYLDESCTNHLQISTDSGKTYNNVELTCATYIDEDGNECKKGLYTLEYLPNGMYYIKETKAPIYKDGNGGIHEYEVSDEIIELDLNDFSSPNNIFCKVYPNRSKPEYTVEKSDIFTSEKVPNCLFTITDEEGNELLRFITNEDGEAKIPTDIFKDGEKYYFTELEVLDKNGKGSVYYEDNGELLELNTEPHEFIAHLDEDKKWNMIGKDENGNIVEYEKISIKNHRNSKPLRVLKVDEKTGKPLQGCVFSIILTDEKGNPITRDDGSLIYLAENAVTDENGEYFIEKAYYGTYKFIEVKAPEGYYKPEELEGEMEGYLFTIDKNSPDGIDFIVTNTGDIAVVAISVLALVSMVGIILIVRKNKIEKSTK